MSSFVNLQMSMREMPNVNEIKQFSLNANATIKVGFLSGRQHVETKHKAKDGQSYQLNLMDTPGHVDFNYEVSRSLNACEGALLVVDATQGIEAQTLANAYLAVDANLEIVPVINKIDLPSADIDRCRNEVEDIIGIPAEDCPAVSAKTGLNIPDVLEAVVHNVPAPEGDPDAPLRALIFDSYYDSYLGVVVYIRIVDGTLRQGDKIRLMSNGATFDVTAVGSMEAFGLKNRGILRAGEVGYLTASIKNVSDTRVGDTVTLADSPADEPLPGFQAVHPMVYAGIYPEDGARYGDLRDALEKLRLNDAALTFEPETSTALGFGFRCGFLGLLHMEIIEERLEREFNLDLITTAPSVIYEVKTKDGELIKIDNPTDYPQPDEIEVAYEPLVKANIITPVDYVGGLMELCQNRRGVFIELFKYFFGRHGRTEALPSTPAKTAETLGKSRLWALRAFLSQCRAYSAVHSGVRIIRAGDDGKRSSHLARSENARVQSKRAPLQPCRRRMTADGKQTNVLIPDLCRKTFCIRAQRRRIGGKIGVEPA